MAKSTQGQTRRWLPLGDACRVLEVNESTLRHWADRGQVRVYRTPGGHRRFSRDDVYALLQQGGPSSDTLTPQIWNRSALHRIRRRLRRGGMAVSRWDQAIDEDGKARMRLFGRRLLAAATDYLTQRQRRQELLEEVHLVGQEYGREMYRYALPLDGVVQAFVFFRNSLMDTAWEAAKDQGLRGEELYQAWQQMSLLADRVLTAIVGAYEANRTPVQASLAL